MPAAQRSFIANCSTNPFASTAMVLLSWPPISIISRASGTHGDGSSRVAGDLGIILVRDVEHTPAVAGAHGASDVHSELRRASCQRAVDRGLHAFAADGAHCATHGRDDLGLSRFKITVLAVVEPKSIPIT